MIPTAASSSWSLRHKFFFRPGSRTPMFRLRSGVELWFWWSFRICSRIVILPLAERHLAVGKTDRRKEIHTMWLSGWELERTIKFYMECLEMKLLTKHDVQEETYTDAFLGFGLDNSRFALELTYSVVELPGFYYLFYWQENLSYRRYLVIYNDKSVKKKKERLQLLADK